MVPQKSSRTRKSVFQKNILISAKVFYDMSESFEPLKSLNFDSADEKWLDFVCACRRGENLNQAFDIIYGNVADDDVFKTIDMYFRGLWDKEKKFSRSYEVKVDG